MTTFSYSQPKLNDLSFTDLYLSEPSGPCITNFFAAVPSDISQDLLSKYGRFWISNDSQLYYRQPGDNKDILVQNITVGYGLEGGLIVRVNGIVIPTIALEQLRILLRCGKKCNYNPYSELLCNINNHQINLNRAIY